ncbi:hypothetical protein F4677DRAFT_264092 [Hypoxylon crocopeplum]|nr:hypothetical protein F4677DRAFT_264092 [Hypoxylon crocopeplum]
MAFQEIAGHPAGALGQCPKHGRAICPPCLFNCQEVLLDAPLENKEKTDIYQAYPTQLMFSWSSKHPDLEMLSILADPDFASNKDENYLNTVGENAGWHPLFIPQWDEQVQGVRLWDKFRHLRFIKFKAPTPQDSDAGVVTQYCDKCELTWLKGLGLSNTHPMHNSLAGPEAHSRGLDERSLIVHISAVMLKGVKNGVRKSGLGAYFGPGSKYNQSQPLDVLAPNKQVAELHAARYVLSVIKEQVYPEWLRHLEDMNQDYPSGDLRLIIATDAKMIVDIFTDFIFKWQFDAQKNEYSNNIRHSKARKVIQNSDVIAAIKQQVDEFEDMHTGIEVVWYRISRQFNVEANALAKACAQE